MTARNGAANRPQQNAAGQRNRLGARIKFVGGKYEGKWGWLDPEKSPTKMKTYVFVRKDDKTSTPVMTKHIVNVDLFDPKTVAGAVMQRRPEASSMMKDLCLCFAMCHLKVEHIPEILQVFGDTLHDTIVEHRDSDDARYFREPEIQTESRKRR
jgi:hypothetical protein